MALVRPAGPLCAALAAGLICAACGPDSPEATEPQPSPCANLPCDGFEEEEAQEPTEELEEEQEPEEVLEESQSEEPDPLAFATEELPAGSRGQPYEAILQANGGEPPYAFAVVEGELPEGLDLDAEGLLSGIPSAAGVVELVVEVVDSAEPPEAIDQTFTIEVPEVLLLSGYGPFGGYEVNPSWESVRVLDGERFGDLEVRAVELPVVWDVASDGLLEHVDELEPAAVVASGVAGYRAEAIILERAAFNMEIGEDVEGNVRDATPVVEDGEYRLESTLPLEAIGEALTEAEVSWAFSHSAGRYLCNHLFYELVYATQDTDIPAGFIHISDQNTTVEELTAGWRVVLQAVADSLVELEAPATE